MTPKRTASVGYHPLAQGMIRPPPFSKDRAVARNREPRGLIRENNCPLGGKKGREPFGLIPVDGRRFISDKPGENAGNAGRVNKRHDGTIPRGCAATYLSGAPPPSSRDAGRAAGINLSERCL